MKKTSRPSHGCSLMYTWVLCAVALAVSVAFRCPRYVNIYVSSELLLDKHLHSICLCVPLGCV